MGVRVSPAARSTVPKITVAAKFAEILNVSLEDLIGYEYHENEPNFLDASIGEDLSRFTADDYHLLEDLHQDPRLRMLFDRSRRMSAEDREKMIQIREGAMDDLLTGRVRLSV